MKLSEKVARALCAQMDDDWEREGPEGLMSAYGPLADAAIAAAQPIFEAQDRASELETLLKDCADDLEAEIKARYGDEIHPAMRAKFDADMAVVTAARAALKGDDHG